MTAKEYLSQIKRIDTLINSLNADKEAYMSDRYRLPSPELAEKVQVSPDSDKLTRIVAKILDMEERITKEIDRLIDCRELILSQIYQLEDPKHIELLRRRYVACETWDTIAEELNYTVDYVKKELHGRALEDFYRRFGKTFKKF